MGPISVQFATFGAQMQCCHLQCVYIRSLQFIFSDLRLLVLRGLTHANITGSKSLLYFLTRLAPDVTGVGGSLT